MALATRPKPKTHHRKRQAEHHNKGKLYLKTYWPYLPMLAIVAIGAYANKALYSSITFNAGAGAIGSQINTSRIQSITNNQAGWIYITALCITAVAFGYFVTSHYARFHKLVNKGERYIIRHPYFDIAIVFIFTLGYVITRGTTI